MVLIINGKIVTEKDEVEKIAGTGGTGTDYNFISPLSENGNDISLYYDDETLRVVDNKLAVQRNRFMDYRDYVTSIGTGDDVNLVDMNIGDKITDDSTLQVTLTSSKWSDYPDYCTVVFQWNKNGDDNNGWLKLVVDWKDDEVQRTVYLQHFEGGEFETHTFFNSWGDDEGPFEIHLENGDYWELSVITGDNSNDYKNMPLFTDDGNIYFIEDAEVTTREQYNRNFVYSVNWNITGVTGEFVDRIASPDEFDRIEDFAFLFDIITYRFCYVTARYKVHSDYHIVYIIISGN